MPLPISRAQAIRAITFMKKSFPDKMKAAVRNTPFSVDTLCGIACQETAYVWTNWIGKKSVEDILRLCVFDASGDFPGTQRSAFPKNTTAFRNKYGDSVTNMLIAEANTSRKARGLSPAQWVYKGYGIYQYDLQYIIEDESFFTARGWYDYDQCLQKVMTELNEKWAKYHHMFKTIKAYNGSGPSAEEYANNVTVFISYSKEVGDI